MTKSMQIPGKRIETVGNHVKTVHARRINSFKRLYILNFIPKLYLRYG